MIESRGEPGGQGPQTNQGAEQATISRKRGSRGNAYVCVERSRTPVAGSDGPEST